MVPFIIYATISIILFFLFLKILKSVLKATLIITILSLFSFGILAVLLYQDFTDLKSNFFANPSLILLEKGSQFIAGLTINPSNQNKQYIFLNNQDINNYNTLNDFSSIKGNNYKLVILEYDSLLNSIPENININQETITKQQINLIIISNTPFSELSKIFPQYSESQLKTLMDIKDESELKSSAFALMLQEIQDSKKLLILYKQNNLQVYEETILFKTIKYIPENMLPNINLA